MAKGQEMEVLVSVVSGDISFDSDETEGDATDPSQPTGRKCSAL